MSELTKAERAAIEFVARRFSSTGEGWSDEHARACLTVAGKRIAVEIASIGRKAGALGGKPRLRFDRVVQEIASRLHSALEEIVPRGQTVMITITAPILQPGKTAAALAEGIRSALQRRCPRMQIDATLHGNRVRARLVKDLSERVPRSIVLVHNPDPAADIAETLFRITRALLEHVGAAGEPGKPKGRTGDRWLVLALEGDPGHASTLRQIVSRLGIPHDFEKVLVVLAGGRVEVLAG